ncbi:uncharacterized protein LOC142334205 [Lycorma delicatula]|uniref:uncharacterized protein LOC142334205 n=1 Tax=Lycorma delicatula TaxID=130591 RepID=UPI003F518798
MKPCCSAVLFLPILLILLLAAAVQTAAKGVTHEDIRDAVLSFVHMFRDTTTKLERHEYRERQLGEQLKKMIAGLDKRGRDHDESLKTITDILQKMDERMRKIESNLENQVNAREKGTYTVDTMNESIQSWMTNIEMLVRNQSSYLSSDRVQLDAMEAALNSRIDNLASSLERLESLVLRPSPTTAVDVINYENVINRFEEKLSQLKSTNQDDWHDLVEDKLNNQLSFNKLISHELKNIADTIKQISTVVPDKYDINQLVNSTHEEIDKVKYELILATDKASAKVEEKLDIIKSSMSQDQENLYKAVTEAGVMAEGLYVDVQKSYDQLSKEVKALSKVEQVLIQTADNVLDTKRRIEYGVHQILLEVGDLVKLQAKDLNTTINKRFDNISETIVVNHNGGFNNLSSKIETEISQVWRQIGIMYQQLTASAGALDRLQEQTETYVNGSLHTMDGMEGKVGQITSRMSEIDDNLNYLLGRLSLVTQEFNQIKSGLGTALDNIRSSFLSVQDKVKDVGPGPKPVDFEVEEENKLHY